MEEQYRRKSYLTEKKYQLRYTLVIISSMCVMAIIVGGLTFWDISSNLGKIQAMEILRWDAYIIRIFLLLVATFLIGIFLSHKIIGPIRRIEEALENINKGNFSVRIKLREGDEFLKLSEEINSIAEKLNNISEKDPQVKDEFGKR
ncbi:MAG: HAMP domain-containing protein [Elusimicrobia bacterium]|nr:HAMP domain-containing protein [Elusimicrobiota bacterium]